MRILCRWLRSLTNAPTPPPQTNSAATNNPGTNIAALPQLVLGGLAPKMFEMDSSTGIVTNLGGIAIWQITNNPPLTNEAGLPYIYYAAYTQQTSSDLCTWHDQYSVKEWITDEQPDATVYNFTAIYDAEGHLIWTQINNIDIPIARSRLPASVQKTPGVEYPSRASFIRTVDR
jgi:hypothetical protein